MLIKENVHTFKLYMLLDTHFIQCKGTQNISSISFLLFCYLNKILWFLCLYIYTGPGIHNGSTLLKKLNTSFYKFTQFKLILDGSVFLQLPLLYTTISTLVQRQDNYGFDLSKVTCLMNITLIFLNFLFFLKKKSNILLSAMYVRMYVNII